MISHITHTMVLNITFTVLVLATAVASQMLKQIKPESFKRNAEACHILEKNPYFDIELVIGKPWRIYYTWNMNIENKCLDITFKNATPMIIRRIWNDMYEYLETQPYWDGATLHLTMGKAKHEMLLFADQGVAGTFTGVPNVLRDGNITPARKGVPLLKFQMKMIRAGKFLITMDCHIGVASLSARADQPPYRSEIETAAAELKLGDGFQACINDKNKDEHFLT